ncbi:MAG: thiamine phosphate synthase [Caulobacteraceae bacterium]|nr:thiamine phosphate synthase [Caulobacteraceae bacterium]
MRASAGKADFERLARIAARLGRRKSRAKAKPALPALWFFTDPLRTPEPERITARLPPGSGVVYRAFGAPDALAVARRLRGIARARKLVLLIGADAALALAAGADGVHLPERQGHRVRPLRHAHPRWRITMAAHEARALAAAARSGADAAVVSAVFPSRSPSAGPPIGPVRLARLAGSAEVAVIALGGVNAATAPRLVGARVAGFAAIEGLSGG